MNIDNDGVGKVAGIVSSLLEKGKQKIKKNGQDGLSKKSRTDHFEDGTAHGGSGGFDTMAALKMSMSHERAMKRMEHTHNKEMLTHTANTMTGIESKAGTRRRITTGNTTIEHVTPAAKRAPAAKPTNKAAK